MSYSTTNKTRRLSALLLSTILASGLAAPALAQTAPAPEPYRANDEHGVDLATGTFNLDMEEGSIGPAKSGVTMVRYYGQSSYRDNWSGDLRKTMEGSTEVVTINFGKISDRFTKQGGVWVAAKANGATLSETIPNMTPEFLYRAADGTTLLYKSPIDLNDPSPDLSPNIDMPGAYCGSANAVACGVPVEKVEPDGSKYTLTWQTPDQCVMDEEFNAECTRTYRLSDVRSSSSYGIKFKYQSDQNFTGSPGNQGLPPSGWQIRSGLKLLDLSQVYCDPTANNCDGVAGSWPTVAYSTPSTGVVQITNDKAGTWRIDTSGGTQVKIRRPGQSTDTTIVDYSGGKVSSITTDGQTKSYTWGTSGGNPAVSTSDGVGSTGSVTTLPYTTSYRPVTEVDGAGQTTAYSYDGNGRLTRETRPEGDYTNYSYDGRGNVTETRHVAKSGSGLADIVSSASYDSGCTYAAKCNKPNYTIDARGNRTDYTYDTTTGELTRVQMPAATGGGTRPEINYAYSSLSAQVKDAGGNLVSQPAQAKLTQVTTCATAATCSGTANETKITIAYNTPNLLPTSVTTAAGDGSISSAVGYAYDANDNLVAIDGPLSGSDDTVTYVYDAQNRRRGVIGPDPDGGSSRPRGAERYTFDTESRITKIETGTVTAASEAALNAMTVAQTIDIMFDANGNKVKEIMSGTSGAAQVVQYSYDAGNRLSCTALRMNPAIFASLPSSACTLGTAGSGGNDFGADRIVKNTYDANSRVTKVQTAFGAAEQADEVTTGYTANGQTDYVIDAENNRTEYGYDGHDRLLKTEYPSATKGANAANTSDYEQLGCDANGNVTSRRLRDGSSIGYAFDNLDRLVSKDTPNVASGDYDISYGYDLFGRLTNATTGPGHPNSFTYDALGRMTLQQMYNTYTVHAYDAAGRRTRMSWADGNYAQYDYDTTGNVTHIRENGASSGVGVLATYAYDNLGRRSSVTRGNGTVTSYGYDPVSRLSSLTEDLAGSSHDQSATFGYNPASQIDSLAKSNDAYAWAGHYNIDRVSAGNGLNQLIAATPGSGQVSVPTITHDAKGNSSGIGGTAYGYTADNRLAGSGGISFLYEPSGDQILQMYNSGTGADTRFGWDGAQMNIEINAANWTTLRRYVHGPGTDEPIVAYEGAGLSNRRWLHADERGSIVAVTDGSGNVVATNTYDEYGNPGSGNATVSQGGRFGYTGQAWLPEIGMWYYKARIYNPALGRFMQTDPIGYGDGMNWMNYVGGDPVNFTDPTGRNICAGNAGSSWTKFYDNNRNGAHDAGEKVVSRGTCPSDPSTLGGLNRTKGNGSITAGGGGTGTSSICRRPSSSSGADAAGFVFGAADGLSFGAFSELWGFLPHSGIEALRNTAGYDNGQIASFGLGAGRLAYAGSASALKYFDGKIASQARNILKGGFSGLGSFHPRAYSYEALLAKYGSDPAVAQAASRTNQSINNAAAGVVTSSTVSAAVHSGC